MTLRDLIRDNSALFYRQTWYAGEAFMQNEVNASLAMPSGVVIDDARKAPETAANLAYLYVQDPFAPIWRRYLWTSDKDSHGQQVFMGVNNGQMEIHRHLFLTERFGVPIWQ